MEPTARDLSTLPKGGTKMSSKKMLAMTLLVGVMGLTIASNTLAAPSKVTANGWTRLGGNPLVPGGVNSRNDFVRLVTSQKGATAMMYAGLSQAEINAVVNAARTGQFRYCKMSYGMRFERMSFGINGTSVDRDVMFLDPRYRTQAANAWCVDAPMEMGKNLSSVVSVLVPWKCGNIAVIGRASYKVPPVPRPVPVPKPVPPAKPAPKPQPAPAPKKPCNCAPAPKPATKPFVMVSKTLTINGVSTNEVPFGLREYKAGTKKIVNTGQMMSGKTVKYNYKAVGNNLCEVFNAPVKAISKVCFTITGPGQLIQFVNTNNKPTVAPPVVPTPPVVTPVPAPVVFCLWNGQPLYAAPSWSFTIKDGVCVATAVTTTTTTTTTVSCDLATHHIEKDAQGVDVCINNVNVNTNTNIVTVPVTVPVTVVTPPPAPVVVTPAPVVVTPPPPVCPAGTIGTWPTCQVTGTTSVNGVNTTTGNCPLPNQGIVKTGTGTFPNYTSPTLTGTGSTLEAAQADLANTKTAWRNNNQAAANALALPAAQADLANQLATCPAPPPAVPQPPSLSGQTVPEEIFANGETYRVCVNVTAKAGDTMKVTFSTVNPSNTSQGGLGSIVTPTVTITSTGVDPVCSAYKAPNETSSIGKNDQIAYDAFDVTNSQSASRVYSQSFPIKSPPARR
ncbi:hypothetical protein BVY00_02585 [bacterium G20]|nr:hypothetical protein BVY00_02585 [bacterium G20]